MSINLVAAVMQVLQPELVTKIAGALAVEPAAASKAVSAAVPAVLGGYARKAASQNGASELGALIEAQSTDVRGQLATLLSGDARAETLATGLKLLERALGGPAKDVLIGVLGKYAGIDPQKIAGLLAIIMPIVTSILASYHKAGIGNGGGVIKLLAAQQTVLDQSLPARFASMFAETTGAPAPALAPAAVSGSLASGMAIAVASAAAAVLAKPAIAAAATEVGTVTEAVDRKSVRVSVQPVAAEISETLSVERSEEPLTPAPAVVEPAARAEPPIEAVEAVAVAKPVPSSVDAIEEIEAVAVLQPARMTGMPAPKTVAPPPPREAAVALTPVNVPPEQSIIERRRSVPVAAWLLPLVFAVAGAAWWWQASVGADRDTAATSQARQVDEQKTDDAVRLKAEAETAAARQKADLDAVAAKAAEDARRKAESEKQAVAAVPAQTAADNKQKADADAAAQKLIAEAEAKRKSEAEVARSAAEAESKRKVEAEAASKAIAEADARRKAEADAASQKASAEAEAKRKSEAEAARSAGEAKAAAEARAAAEAKTAVEAEAKLKAATVAKASSPPQAQSVAPAAVEKATSESPRPESVACQKIARELAAAVKLQFDYASVIIQDETPLMRFASSLRKCPSARIRIEGHSDSNGDISRNQALSEDRAKAVAAFLVSSGVAAERVVAKGYGETRPIALNDTESNRARNRRIEVVVE